MIYVDVDKKRKVFLLSFPFNRVEVDLVKSLPVRSWNPRLRCWEVPWYAFIPLEKLKVLTWTSDAVEVRENIRRYLLGLVEAKTNQNHLVVPSTLKTSLRDYQKVGIKFLVAAKKCILADDMGLGKTVQALTACVLLGKVPTLILTPATLKWNWYAEFQKHFGITPLVITGNKQQRAALWKENSQFKIANYELLVHDWDIMSHDWGIIVADEAVYLKNPAAQRSKQSKRLRSEYCFALSGFPLENNLLEFYSIFQFVRPEVLPNLWRFKERYCVLDHFGNVVGYKPLEEVHTLTAPFVLRRKKADVLKELPPKNYVPVSLELPDAARNAYNSLCEEYWTWFLETKPQQMSALERTLRLRQFVEFPDIVGFPDLPNFRLDWVSQVLKEVGKLVIFTPFVSSLLRLQERFQTPYLIYGDVPDKERVDIIREFNSVAGGVLLSTDAGRFGLNITGASTLIHYGYVYNPVTLVQREDRLHRLGQTDSVTILKPSYLDTIDVGIQSVLAKRLVEDESFLEGGVKMRSARLRIEDFYNLISGKEARATN